MSAPDDAGTYEPAPALASCSRAPELSWLKTVLPLVSRNLPSSIRRSGMMPPSDVPTPMVQTAIPASRISLPANLIFSEWSSPSLMMMRAFDWLSARCVDFLSVFLSVLSASSTAAARSDPPEGMTLVSSWLIVSCTAVWSMVSGAIDTAAPEKAMTPMRSLGKV